MISLSRRLIYAGVLIVIVLGFFTLSTGEQSHARAITKYPKQWAASYTSSSTPAENVEPETVHKQIVTDPVLHDSAEKVYFILKSGAGALQTRLPAQARTTLTRWPNHAVYADVATKIYGVEVLDALALLPEAVKTKPELDNYRLMQQLLREQWNWDLDWLTPFNDLSLDRYKYVPMLAHAWMKAPAEIDWFFIMDADSYVFQENLLNYLDTLDPAEPHYIGRPADWTTDGPDPSGNDEKIEFALGGPGIALSRAAVERLFGSKTDTVKITKVIEWITQRAHGHCCGDALLAIALNYFVDGLKVQHPWSETPYLASPFLGASTRNIMVSAESLCMPVFTWHKLRAREVDILFDYEQLNMTHIVDKQGAEAPKKAPTTTFDDIYVDFILPYVVAEREHWDGSRLHEELGSADVWDITDNSWKTDGRSEPFRPHTGERQLDPPAIKDDCRIACSKRDDCTMWIWMAGMCRLHAGSIAGGQAVNHMQRGFGKDTTTGWMVSRIREIRAQASCDPLQVKKSAKQYNDDLTHAEGWFVREVLQGDSSDTASLLEVVGEKALKEQNDAQDLATKEEEARVAAARIEDSIDPEAIAVENDAHSDSAANVNNGHHAMDAADSDAAANPSAPSDA